MAVPAAQITNRPSYLGTADHFEAEQEGLATTSSFVTIIQVDPIDINRSTIIIHNSAAGDLDWQILGTTRALSLIEEPTGTDDDDKGWVTIVSGSISTTVAPTIETQSEDPYTRYVVQVKHTTLTTTANVWFTGRAL